MATTADIRNGLCIDFNNDLFQIIEFQHVKPGKGPAFVRTKMKSLTTGRVLDNTFTSGFKIEVVRIERRQYQYLYTEGDAFHFMNNETFEQTFLDKSMITAPELMKEGLVVDILFHADNERVLTCEMPAFVDLQITYSEPGVRGDTATNTLKEATLETGANVKVPLFINVGDTVRVDTRTGKYSERVKV